MMLKEKSNPWARLKYLYVLPLAAIAVTAFARPEISGKMDEISAVKVNDFVQIVGTKVPEKKVEVLKDTVKKDAPKEEAFEVSWLETVPTHSKVTITDGMKRSGMDLFSVKCRFSTSALDPCGWKRDNRRADATGYQSGYD